MPIHVVHIEDDSPLREVLDSALRAAEPNIVLQQYISGEEALPYIQEHVQSVDLFVLDLRLAGKLTGLDVARLIRQFQCPGHIVLTSAYRSPDQEALTALHAEYIPKPWHVIELTQKLLDLRPRREPSKPISAALAPDPSATGSICRNCGQSLRPGQLICPRCSTLVVEPRGLQTQRLDHGLFAAVRLLSSTGEAALSAKQIVTLEAKQIQLPLPGAEEVLIGRQTDTQRGVQRVVGLTVFGDESKWVSRRHILLRRRADALYVMDLASTNGSWLNGQPLEPHQDYLVRNADRLRLGIIELEVRFRTPTLARTGPLK